MLTTNLQSSTIIVHILFSTLFVHYISILDTVEYRYSECCYSVFRIYSAIFIALEKTLVSI